MNHTYSSSTIPPGYLLQELTGGAHLSVIIGSLHATPFYLLPAIFIKSSKVALLMLARALVASPAERQGAASTRIYCIACDSDNFRVKYLRNVCIHD